MSIILINEYKGLIRNNTTRLILALLFVALGVTTVSGVFSMQEQRESQQLANEVIRAQWDNMDAKNPHSAAHYGAYVVKPLNPVSALDPGINALVGNVLKLEAHKQNQAAHTAQSQSLLMSKFGALSPAIVLQFIVPILLIFLTFRALANEKEHERLKVITMQGVSVFKLVCGKVFAYWLLSLIFLVIVVALQTLIFESNNALEMYSRMFVIFITYASYYLIVCTTTACLTLKFKHSTGLTAAIVVWMLWSIFLPKIFGSLAELTQPLPERHAFKQALAEDRSKGIDGHNPYDDRRQKFEEGVLKEYQVATVEELPINIDGLRMQADEEYGNQVWDKHYLSLYGIFQRQKQFYQISGVVNPFVSLQNLSMGAAGSDNFHRIEYLQQAENYRREFVRLLNLKHAYGGSKSGDWDWKVDQAFFKTVPDFNYQEPTFMSSLSHYLIDVLLLLVWLNLSFLLLYQQSKKYKFL